jgi:hypothetical protein
MSSTETTRSADQQRAEAPRFRAHWALAQLQTQLPLVFPSTPTPEVPDTFRTRSWYTYPGWEELTDPDSLATLDDFYVAVHLIDFTPLRGELVQLSGIHVNGRGETPFDPVSLFVCCLLRWETGKGWRKLAKFLAGPEGACWRRLCGFRAGDTPAESTLRHFFHALGPAFDRDLCPRFIELLRTAELLPPHDAESTAPARDGLPVATDGMLHDAHEQTTCSKVQATCYQPTMPDQPRPCPARDAGQRGCACDADVCRDVCRRATPRDPEARFIHYTGRNQEGEEDPRRARNVHGYRSYAHTLVDDELHIYWNVYTSVHPANNDERVIFPQDFVHLRQRLPRLPISELVADAALGYGPCLTLIYDADAIPVVEIRHHNTDDEPETCRFRGYDAQGHPLCPHGYPMAFNGLDYERLRATWVCRQVCRRAAHAPPEDATCPYRDSDRPLGMSRHVTDAFTHPDGSRHARLARLFAYDSPTWQDRYDSRRNATESRNSQLENLQLKQIWSYGLDGAIADITFADLLINLRTLGRLVRQASLLSS